MESPGTAPGSEPRIMGAFIAIFPVTRNTLNIGAGARLCKRLGAVCNPCFLRALSVHTKNQTPQAQKTPRKGLRGVSNASRKVNARSKPGFDVFEFGQHPVTHFCRYWHLRQKG